MLIFALEAMKAWVDVQSGTKASDLHDLYTKKASLDEVTHQISETNI